MSETAILVSTALCSGLVATVVTILWQKYERIKSDTKTFGGMILRITIIRRDYQL